MTSQQLVFLLVCFFLPIITGFFFAEIFRDALAYLTFAALVIAGWWAEINVIAVMYAEYKQRYDDSGSRRPLFDSKPIAPRAPLKDMNAYRQVTSGIRIDAEKHCAGVLWGKWQHSGKINITEDWWLKPRVNSSDPTRKLPKRWLGENAEFQQMKLRWESDGIIEKKNPNHSKSGFIVRDVDALRRKAEGRQ